MKNINIEVGLRTAYDVNKEMKNAAESCRRFPVLRLLQVSQEVCVVVVAKIYISIRLCSSEQPATNSRFLGGPGAPRTSRGSGAGVRSPRPGPGRPRAALPGRISGCSGGCARAAWWVHFYTWSSYCIICF